MDYTALCPRRQNSSMILLLAVRTLRLARNVFKTDLSPNLPPLLSGPTNIALGVTIS
jgi:hypothetical protein